jgi:hypothetical protein
MFGLSSSEPMLTTAALILAALAVAALARPPISCMNPVV